MVGLALSSGSWSQFLAMCPSSVVESQFGEWKVCVSEHTSTSSTQVKDVLSRDTCICLEAVQVLLRAGWPSFGELGTLGLGAEIVANDVLPVLYTLRVNAGHSLGQFFLLGDEVHREICRTALALDIGKGCGTISFEVSTHSLWSG